MRKKEQPDREPALDWESSIASWIREVKFRRRILGGVDEGDVFRKFSVLNDMYHHALMAERARYEALLSQKREEGR